MQRVALAACPCRWPRAEPGTRDSAARGPMRTASGLLAALLLATSGTAPKHGGSMARGVTEYRADAPQLLSLVVSPGALKPKFRFNATALVYAVLLPYGTDVLKLTAQARKAGAPTITQRVDGAPATPVTHGVPSAVRFSSLFFLPALLLVQGKVVLAFLDSPSYEPGTRRP